MLDAMNATATRFPAIRFPLTRFPGIGFLAAGLLGLALAAPCAADSVASSASSAGSASVGSLSDSITGSSDASSRGGKVAGGQYLIVAIAALPGERQRLQLQAVAPDRPGTQAGPAFALELPVAAAALAVGERIEVMDRPYGLAFARADSREAFFVALADTWRGDLDLKRVTL